MKPFFVELSASSPTELRAQAKAAVDDTLHQRTNLLVLGLDRLSILDDAAIAASIVALRGLRESGGRVGLMTQRVAHRRRLALMGLDRIFEVFASIEDAQAPPGVRKPRRRA